MIVGKDQPGAAMAGGVRYHFTQREAGATLVAFVPAEVDTARMVIDMGDPQMLAGWIAFGNAAGEKSLGRREPVQSKR